MTPEEAQAAIDEFVSSGLADRVDGGIRMKDEVLSAINTLAERMQDAPDPWVSAAITIIAAHILRPFSEEEMCAFLTIAKAITGEHQEPL